MKTNVVTPLYSAGAIYAQPYVGSSRPTETAGFDEFLGLALPFMILPAFAPSDLNQQWNDF